MADKFLDDLIEMSREAEDAHAEWIAAKETAKMAKDKWDGHMETIMARLKRRREEDSDPDRLKFADDDELQPTGTACDPDSDVVDVDFSQPAISGPVADPDPAASDDDSWKQEPLSSLIRFGLGEKTVEKLAESGLSTVGGMAAWLQAGKRLTDLDGIGEAKATEIEDAFDSFWGDRMHRQASRPEPKRRKTG